MKTVRSRCTSRHVPMIHDDVVELVKEQATTRYATQDDHNKVLVQLEQLSARLDNVERLLGLRNGTHVKLSVVNGGIA